MPTAGNCKAALVTSTTHPTRADSRAVEEEEVDSAGSKEATREDLTSLTSRSSKATSDSKEDNREASIPVTVEAGSLVIVLKQDKVGREGKEGKGGKGGKATLFTRVERVETIHSSVCAETSTTTSPASTDKTARRNTTS